jgi:type II secretory pathway component PulC
MPERWLVITGIIAYTDPRQGYAIIGTDPQNTYLARPGERLPDGALIREIHPRQVVLEYDGREETVGIYERAEPVEPRQYAQSPPSAEDPPLPQLARTVETDLQWPTADELSPSQRQSTDERGFSDDDQVGNVS